MIDNVYRHVDGRLVLKPERLDMKGWPAGAAEAYGPLLRDCFDRGGTFYGAFEDGKLIGVAAERTRELGARRLYVSGRRPRIRSTSTCTWAAA